MSIHGRPLHPWRVRLALTAIGFASFVSILMLAVRAFFAGEIRFGFLPWNLFLAWIPLLFALAADRLHRTTAPRWTWFGVCAVVWFLFYPNAPYLITDLVHLKTRPPIPRWFDLILMMSFAWTGLFLGSFSLYLMQEIVRARVGRNWSWRFVVIKIGRAHV